MFGKGVDIHIYISRFLFFNHNLIRVFTKTSLKYKEKSFKDNLLYKNFLLKIQIKS